MARREAVPFRCGCPAGRARRISRRGRADVIVGLLCALITVDFQFLRGGVKAARRRRSAPSIFGNLIAWLKLPQKSPPLRFAAGRTGSFQVIATWAKSFHRPAAFPRYQRSGLTTSNK